MYIDKYTYTHNFYKPSQKQKHVSFQVKIADEVFFSEGGIC